MRDEKDYALRGINRKQREPTSPCNSIEESESCPIGETNRRCAEVDITVRSPRYCL